MNIEIKSYREIPKSEAYEDILNRVRGNLLSLTQKCCERGENETALCLESVVRLINESSKRL